MKLVKIKWMHISFGYITMEVEIRYHLLLSGKQKAANIFQIITSFSMNTVHLSLKEGYYA